MPLLAALDIGSSKIVCLIAEKKDNALFVKSIAHTPAKGFYAGEITNLFNAVESLRRNVAEAEEKIKVQVKGVFVHCAFKQLMSRSLYIKRVIDRYVTEEDIASLIAFAKEQLHPPPQWQIMTSGPVCFFIDNIKMTSHPVLCPAHELGILFYATFVKRETIAAMRRCLDQAHLELLDIFPSPTTSALACLTPEDIENGAIHIDMGKSVTGAAIFIAGSPAHIATHSSLVNARAQNMRNTLALLKTKLQESPFYAHVKYSKLFLTGMGQSLNTPSIVQEIFSCNTVIVPTQFNQYIHTDSELDPILFAPVVGTLVKGAQNMILSHEDTSPVGGKLQKAWRWLKEHF